MTTDTSERGLEALICRALAGHPCDPPAMHTAAEPPVGYGGVGWSGGSYQDYDREYCVDLAQLAAFLRATQPEATEVLALGEDGPTRRKFLARLQGEVSKRGTIEVLRHGIRHQAHDLDLFYGTPSQGNQQARERFEQNRFTVTRQLHYSRDETQRALDIAPLHQRPAGNHLRAEEQPHQADGGRRGMAVPQGPQPAREAVRARPLRRALRRGRERGAVLHPPEGQGIVVPALQPRLERRCRATLPTRTGSRPTICGAKCSRERA